MPQGLVVLLVSCMLLGSERRVIAQDPSSSSCSLPGLTPNPKESPTDKALLAAWNAQSARVKSVEASAAVQGWSDTKHSGRPSPVALYFRTPAWLRATGTVPFSGRRTLDLFSNGRQFWLLVPDGKSMHLFEGPVDAPSASTNASANLRPRPLVDALHWESGSLSPVQDPPTGNAAMRTIRFDLPAEPVSPARTTDVEFDLTDGVVEEVVMRDASQRVVLRLNYSDWQPAEENNCYPRHIEVEQPLDDRGLDIRIALLRLNGRIDSREFRMVAPIGAPVTHLGDAIAAGRP